MVKTPPTTAGGMVFDPWSGEGNGTSTLGWKIPWMEESGGLLSMGSLRVGHDWVTALSLFTFTHWRRKWQPTRVLAWRIPGTGEPGGLPSMGLHRVGHDWSNLAAREIRSCMLQGVAGEGLWAKIVNNNKKQTGYLFSPVCYHVRKIGFRWSSSGAFGFVSNCNWS